MPQASDVVEVLGSFWLIDEPIIYIGKASSLRQRLGQYFRHELGDRRPHAGGHWIKTLECLQSTFIHYAETATESDARKKEDDALTIFKAGVSSQHRSRITNPIPFANREHPRGSRKQRDIGHDVLR